MSSCDQQSKKELANTLTIRTATGSLNGAPSVLDTAAVKTSAQWHTLLNLGVTLLTHDAQGRLVGDGAESWTISPDFLEFSFKLKPDIKDSTGKLTDSSDWKASILHLLDSGGSTHSFVSEFLTKEGVQIPDGRTLVLKLKKPYKTLLQRLTTPEFILLPKGAFISGKMPNFSVTTGAYFVERISETPNECVLAANLNFRGYSPDQPQRVVLVGLAKTNKEAFENLASSKWQFYLGTVLPTDPDYPALQASLREKKISAATVEQSSLALVILQDSKRLKTRAQRLALAKLLGEKAEKEFKSPSSRPTHQIYPLGFVGAVRADREAKLFQEIQAEKTNIKDVPKHLIGYAGNTSIVTGVAGWVTKALKDAGIDTETHVATAKDYVGHQHEIDHDYMVLTTGLNSKDPAGSLLYLVSPKDGMIPDPDGSLNQLLQTAVQAEPKQMSDVLHQLSERLVSGGRVIPLMHYGTVILSSPDVSARPPTKYDDELRLANIRWLK